MTALVQPQQQQQEPSTYTDPTFRHPVNMQQSEKAKNIFVYKNGDQYYPGRKFVVNKRHVSDFNGLLNLVTDGLKPSFGAVRSIYTPTYGHRVHDLETINNGMAVVAGGMERFRKLHYQEITAPRRAVHRITHNDTIRPVHHNTKMNVAARWKAVNNEPCTIFVYANGDSNGKAEKVLLIPRTMKLWGNVLQEVTDKLIKLPGNVQAVRRLFTVEGAPIHDSEQLRNGNYYVGVGSDKFKHVDYGKRAQHMAMMHSPRRGHVQLPPIRTRARTLNSTKPSSYSQKYAERKQMEEVRTQHSQPPPGAIRHQGNRKLRPIRGTAPPPTTESESVFHAKPVKVKRSGASGKITAVSTMEEKEDDLFRSRRQPTKAEEVADDEDTKVDLPIDQVPADTVEDEEVLDVAVKPNVEENRYRTPTPDTPKPTYATRLDDDDTESSKSTKTPTSPRKDEPQPSARKDEEPQPSDRNIGEANVNGSANHSQPEVPDKTEKSESSKIKEENEAAIIIQSRYKGYRTRQQIKQQKEIALSSSVTEESERKPNDEDLTHEENEISQVLHDSEKPLSASNNDPTQHLDKQEQPVTPLQSETKESVPEVKAETPPPLDNTVPPVNDGNVRTPTPSREITEEPLDPNSEPQNNDHEVAIQDEPTSLENDPPRAKSQLSEHEPIKENVDPAEPTFDLTTGQANTKSRSNSRESINEPATTQNTAEEGKTLPERDEGDGIEENRTGSKLSNKNLQDEKETHNEKENHDQQDKDTPARPDPLTQNGNGEIIATTKTEPETAPIPNGQPAAILD